MLNPTLLVLLASAGLIEGRSVLEARHLHGLMDRRSLLGDHSLREPRHVHGLFRKRQDDDATATVLAANAIQSGSFLDGSVNGVLADGQSKSQTSQNNFINNCVGKTLTNGLQVIGGSCNGIRKSSMPLYLHVLTICSYGRHPCQNKHGFQYHRLPYCRK